MVVVEEPATHRAAATGGGLRMLQAGLPIGFRFRPTDEELLLHYLRRKVLSCPLPADIIPVADLARLHPWDLPGEADGERYFFYLPATSCWRKGGGGRRAAGTGVWRVSGKEKLLVGPRCKLPVGSKRTLVFCHLGGARTEWAMHEYRLLPAAVHPMNPLPHTSSHAPEANDWVVCRIFKKTTPAHRRSPPCIRGTARRRADDDMPSSPSSCVTEARENGGDDGEEEEESNSTSRCTVASNCP
ncbi:hypothetical protein GUJ93_ZPchr0001g30695 [Zizania palustris]|uniref:NAC domain-containing protein n=1 Tax=Zizania palustris TaxID=103762 RepID=A0A8J5RYG3_ZIZPA|nr:hypothetical protein GUJ93_ZPchr0001g30695 [Zizania palustris]